MDPFLKGNGDGCEPLLIDKMKRAMGNVPSNNINRAQLIYVERVVMKWGRGHVYGDEFRFKALAKEQLTNFIVLGLSRDFGDRAVGQGIISEWVTLELDHLKKEKESRIDTTMKGAKYNDGPYRTMVRNFQRHGLSLKDLSEKNFERKAIEELNAEFREMLEEEDDEIEFGPKLSNEEE